MKDWPEHTLESERDTAAGPSGAASTLEQLKGGAGDGEDGRDDGSPGAFTDDFLGAEVKIQ